MALYFMFAGITLACLAVVFACPWKLRVITARRIIYISSCVLLLGGGLYAYLGKPHMVALLQARQRTLKELAPRIKTLEMLVKENPENSDMWAGLGQAFLEGEQYAAAVNAFKQAVLTSGGHPQWILLLAKAQIIEAGGMLTEEAKRGLEIVLEMTPENAEAKRLLALPPRP